MLISTARLDSEIEGEIRGTAPLADDRLVVYYTGTDRTGGHVHCRRTQGTQEDTGTVCAQAQSMHRQSLCTGTVSYTGTVYAKAQSRTQAQSAHTQSMHRHSLHTSTVCTQAIYAQAQSAHRQSHTSTPDPQPFSAHPHAATYPRTHGACPAHIMLSPATEKRLHLARTPPSRLP